MVFGGKQSTIRDEHALDCKQKRLPPAEIRLLEMNMRNAPGSEEVGCWRTTSLPCRWGNYFPPYALPDQRRKMSTSESTKQCLVSLALRKTILIVNEAGKMAHGRTMQPAFEFELRKSKVYSSKCGLSFLLFAFCLLQSRRAPEVTCPAHHASWRCCPS